MAEIALAMNSTVVTLSHSLIMNELTISSGESPRLALPLWAKMTGSGIKAKILTENHLLIAKAKTTTATRQVTQGVFQVPLYNANKIHTFEK